MRRIPSRPRWVVELNGFGQVGRALVPLLRRPGIGLGSVRDSSGLRAHHTGPGRRVFVDATSPRYEGPAAEAWVRRLEEVLREGTPVVTCNKAPLALGWRRLAAAAREGGTTLSCSGTVGGGTPILLLLERLHRSQGVERVEAALNATLGYVCDRVVEGVSIAAALAEARRFGIAEPDPSLDLDGTDSLAKAVIVHNLLFAERRPFVLDPARPRLRLREDRILEVARSGELPRAVCTVTPRGIRLALAGFPQGTPSTPGAPPTTVRATLRDGSETVLSGPGAGPRATAGALLGDLLALAGSPRESAQGVLP